MSSEEKLKVNNKHLSLFSGCGGLDIGMERAGFTTIGFIEIDKSCCETLNENANNFFQYGKVINEDITKLECKDISKLLKIKKGELALISGGPPCQSFSNIGNRKGLTDSRGRLVFDFLRFINELKPVAFIFENVPGLKTLDKGETISLLLKEFVKTGYLISGPEILRSVNYGVPQNRKRLFIVGSREGISLKFPNPTHGTPEEIRKNQSLKKWKTIRDAFEELPTDYCNRDDCIHMNSTPKIVNMIKMVKPGENFQDLPNEILPNCWKNGKHKGRDTFGRLEWEKPSVTIRTCGFHPMKGRYIHPEENRGLNTIEMAALQTFPYDYKFYGNLTTIGRQIGNAVPPLLAEVIGKEIMEQIIKGNKKQSNINDF